MNGADIACDALLANGVDTWFANPGTSEMHLVAALDRRPEIRCVLGLFEGVVTGAADGYGRMRDTPAATLLHCGPGLANGLANLHNARRAGTPIINIVGDHAGYHLPYDAPLTSDIESLARPMSDWVGRVAGTDSIAMMIDQAYAASVTPPGVATLIMPADAAWSDGPATELACSGIAIAADVAEEPLRETVKVLGASRNALMLLGGNALREAPLAAAAAICAKTGARLMAANANGRMERGTGRVPIGTLPYAVDLAVHMLADVDLIVCIGTTDPVAFFAYPGKPSRIRPPATSVIELATRGEDPARTVLALAEMIGARPVPSHHAPAAPELPRTGRLSGTAIAAVTANLLPDGAIVCRESVTQAAEFAGFAAGAAPHDLLSLTGGAIGVGIPLSIGAAIACPDRKVICLQADGSGMYTCQGLWTQARENLDIVTIILSNRTYAVLHNEMKQVGVGQIGDNARQMLNLDRPVLDWVSLARGMGVEAAYADTVEGFVDLMRSALARRGPFLIEAELGS